MRTIYKYEVPVEDRFTLSMPFGADVLTVQVDQKTDKPCIWVTVETFNSNEERVFKFVGTGHPFIEEAGQSYVGTIQLMNGGFVGHLFEIIP